MEISSINNYSINNSIKDFSKKDQRTDNSGHVRKLTVKEERELKELKNRDQEVREHEKAHKRVAGQYARSAPSYDYEIGKDGKKYAVEGEIELDISKVPNDPEATILKMQQIKRAALAPVDPSAQDRRVAADAAGVEAKARREALEEKQEEEYSQPGLNSTYSNKISRIYTDSQNPSSIGQQFNSLV